MSNFTVISDEEADLKQWKKIDLADSQTFPPLKENVLVCYIDINFPEALHYIVDYLSCSDNGVYYFCLEDLHSEDTTIKFLSWMPIQSFTNLIKKKELE